MQALSYLIFISLAVAGLVSAHSTMVCMDVNVEKASSSNPIERCNIMARAFDRKNHDRDGAGGLENWGWNSWQGWIPYNKEYSYFPRNGCDAWGGEKISSTTPGQSGCVDWTENYKCAGCKYGVLRPGDSFRPMHYARTHAHGEGGIVKIFMYQFDQNVPEHVEFAIEQTTPVCTYYFNSSCAATNRATSPCFPVTPCTIPMNTAPGTYTLVWRWYWHDTLPQSNDYVAAADFVVLPAGSTPTSAPTSPPTSPPTNPCAASIGSGTGLTGQFYSDVEFNTLVDTQVSSTIDFDYGYGAPSGLGGNFFSVKWQGKIQAKYSDTYTIYVVCDDAVLLKINGNAVVSDLEPHSARESSGTISLVAGQKYDIEIQFQEYQGEASIKMYWSSSCQQKEIIPQSQLYIN